MRTTRPHPHASYITIYHRRPFLAPAYTAHTPLDTTARGTYSQQQLWRLRAMVAQTVQLAPYISWLRIPARHQSLRGWWHRVAICRTKQMSNFWCPLSQRLYCIGQNKKPKRRTPFDFDSSPSHSPAHPPRISRYYDSIRWYRTYTQLTASNGYRDCWQHREARASARVCIRHTSTTAWTVTLHVSRNFTQRIGRSVIDKSIKNDELWGPRRADRVVMGDELFVVAGGSQV